MIVYKVVKELGAGGWESAFCNGFPCRYGTGLVARPQIGHGPLAAFRTLEDAWRFYRNSCLGKVGHRVIFRAEAEPAGKRVKNLWYQLFSRREVNKGIDSLPEGTVLCSSITLLEEVK